MKLRLMICAAAASTALFATEDANSATYAVMNVTNAYTDTVIAVPWVGFNGSAITISNLVNTSTLTAGDKLYMYDGSDGNWYECTKNAEGQWEGSTTVSGASSLNAASQTVGRGTGLILQRAASGAGGTVLLAGRVGTGDVTTTIAANGKTLFANPKSELVNITVGNVGDKISVPGNGGTMKTYEMKSDGWYETVTDDSFGFPVTRMQKIATGVPLAAGNGAFYENKGSSAVIIEW